jgi:stage III sporulation protein SpoIIIAA
VSLVQIGAAGMAFVFDLQSPSASSAIVDALRFLLESSSMKCIHDCRQPIAALKQLLRIDLAPVIDTQVLFSVVQSLREVSGDAHVDKRRVSVNSMLEACGCPTIAHAADIERQLTPAVWQRRPVDRELLQYAAGQVLFLGGALALLENRFKSAVAEAVCVLSAHHATSAIVQPQQPQQRQQGGDDASFALGFDAKCVLDVDVAPLIDALPASWRERLAPLIASPSFCELRVDAGAPPVVVMRARQEIELQPIHELGAADMSAALGALAQSLNAATGAASSGVYALTAATVFTATINRLGLPRSLHTVCAARNQRGHIVTLTYRVGAHYAAADDLLVDVVASLSGGAAKPSGGVLFLGAHGNGKSTAMRSAIATLSAQRQVAVVDTFNELGGDSDVAHRSLARSQRLQVMRADTQHCVMIEAADNYRPHVVAVDQLLSVDDAGAACTLVAQRGVAVLAAVHHDSVGALLADAAFAPLADAFTVAVQFVGVDRVRIYRSLADAAAAFRSDHTYLVEERWRDAATSTLRATRFFEHASGRRDPISQSGSDSPSSSSSSANVAESGAQSSSSSSPSLLKRAPAEQVWVYSLIQDLVLSKLKQAQ